MRPRSLLGFSTVLVVALCLFVLGRMATAKASLRLADVEREARDLTVQLSEERKRRPESDEVYGRPKSSTPVILGDAGKSHDEARNEKNTFDAKADRAVYRNQIARKQLIQSIARLEKNERPLLQRLGLSDQAWSEYEKLVVTMKRPLSADDDAKIRDVLGEDLARRLKQEQAARVEQAGTKRLENRLLLSDEPLSTIQIEQLAALEVKSRQTEDWNSDFFRFEIQSEARRILSPNQFTAWLELDEVDLSNRRLNSLMSTPAPVAH